MKCHNCGGEIQLEDLYCPYCGRPNEEAHMHARDMHHYKREFEQTQEAVAEKAGRQSRRAIRIAAVAILLLAIGLNILLQANSYSVQRYFERSANKRNASVYKQKIEEYLEEEDYVGFVSYCYANDLTLSDDLLEPVYPVYRIANSYKYAQQQIMMLICHNKYSDIDHLAKYTSDTICEYYEALDPDNYSYNDSYDTPEVQKHLANIERDMEALLVGYLSMTPEEAAEMPSASRSTRVMLIERGLEPYSRAED